MQGEAQGSFLPITEVTRPPSERVDQETLRARVEQYRPRVEHFIKRPYLVWTGMPPKFTNEGGLAEQSAIPESLRMLGPADSTTYSAHELNNKYQNGGMIIQPDGKGGLEAYPVKASDIQKNIRLSEVDNALRLNPELARIVSENPAIQELIEGGKVIGMVKSKPVQMIKMSDIGYPLDAEVVLSGKGMGQKKPLGEDAYLGIGKGSEDQAVYWMVNCDKDGLPVNYLSSSDSALSDILPQKDK